MNCFEARRDFAGYWRRELDPVRRAELNQHLGACAKCDHAFRSFALTASVLHSEAAPHGAAAAVASPRVAPKNVSKNISKIAQLSPLTRTRIDRPRARPLLAMCASIAILVAASAGAYFATSAPPPSLTDAIGDEQQSTVLDLFGPDLPNPGDDLAG